ncbi:hypothetical protein Bca52824_014664 [Brassica carinata]|uniref:Uncharacterized protein n=1 Tax=Brassica carinata TaxID=52824 RepID=A0A8X7W159_BRACI|nr:hypothetical protein Bca52824_014664 [Brassica carinata]
MRSAYSTTKVLFLVILLLVLVEASWGLSLEKQDPSFNSTDLTMQLLKYRYYRASRVRYGRMRDPKFRVKSNKLAPRDANVDIRWDMTNENDGIYSANVTISNYVMDHQYEQPWDLARIWVRKQTLLGTLGSEGTQHGFVSFSDDDYADTYTYCLNNVTLDLPRQTDQNCIGGTVTFPRSVKAEIEKGSTSFQISVSHYNRGYRAQPPSDVTLTARASEYEFEYDPMEQVIDTHLNTTEGGCGGGGGR